MNYLIKEANTFLKQGDFEYFFCGGFALDVFLKEEYRVHSDIDVSTNRNNKSYIIDFMLSQGWNVYEFCGQGIVHILRDSSKIDNRRNLMCVKHESEIVDFYPIEEKPGFFIHEFHELGIKSFNYIEFLFNDIYEGKMFYCDNPLINKSISKSIMYYNGIPFLSPEWALLYKSSKPDDLKSQMDYDRTHKLLNDEQKIWLNNALDIVYQDGHKWRK